MDSPPSDLDPTIELLTTYNELNSSTIDELIEAPSPLEFLRYVARNRPFVIRGGAADWEAVRSWDVTRLKEVLAGSRVNVAITPNGYADAPTKTQHGEILFLKPHEEEQSFEEFIDFTTAQEQTGHPSNEVRYAQTQNNNVPHEYSLLSTSLPTTIPFARIALHPQPLDALNLWLGNSRSVTALHKDNYENIYVQIIGQKRFVLLPPVAFACVGERMLRGARWTRRERERENREREGSEDDSNDFEIMTDEDDEEGGAGMVPFAVWDPDGDGVAGESAATKYSHLARPMRVSLEAGDMLYLPALWYHKVSQSCSHEGICCAVNYWYDMDFGGIGRLYDGATYACFGPFLMKVCTSAKSLWNKGK